MKLFGNVVLCIIATFVASALGVIVTPTPE